MATHFTPTIDPLPVRIYKKLRAKYGGLKVERSYLEEKKNGVMSYTFSTKKQRSFDDLELFATLIVSERLTGSGNCNVIRLEGPLLTTLQRIEMRASIRGLLPGISDVFVVAFENSLGTEQSNIFYICETDKDKSFVKNGLENSRTPTQASDFMRRFVNGDY